MDREKVIGQLEADVEKAERSGDQFVYLCRTTARNALELLKEKIIKTKPIAATDHDTPDGIWWFVCPKCRFAIDYKDRYCRHCGSLFEWRGVL